MKIKICHVVSGLRSGGVESMIYNYCSHMDCSLFDFSLLYQHEPSQKNVDEFEKLNFHLVRIPFKVKHPIQNYQATYRFFKKHSIDIVHCHMSLVNFFALYAAKKAGVKVRICHSHHVDMRNLGILKKAFSFLCKKLCMKYATDFFACGSEAGEYMYGKKPFQIIYNAIDFDKFQFCESSRNSIRKQFQIQEDEIVLGHIGRFTNQKNHKFLLDVFAKIHGEFPKTKLFLLGDGELKNDLLLQVQKLQLADFVIFGGIVANPSDYYSAFDFFLLPSLYEGLPVVSIEAQLNGLRCFFSNMIDTNVIIDEKRSKLLPLNEEEWVQEVLQAISSSDSSRDIVEEQFNERHLNILLEAKTLEQYYLSMKGGK